MIYSLIIKNNCTPNTSTCSVGGGYPEWDSNQCLPFPNPIVYLHKWMRNAVVNNLVSFWYQWLPRRCLFTSLCYITLNNHSSWPSTHSFIIHSHMHRARLHVPLPWKQCSGGPRVHTLGSGIELWTLLRTRQSGLDNVIIAWRENTSVRKDVV